MSCRTFSMFLEIISPANRNSYYLFLFSMSKIFCTSILNFWVDLWISLVEKFPGSLSWKRETRLKTIFIRWKLLHTPTLCKSQIFLRFFSERYSPPPDTSGKRNQFFFFFSKHLEICRFLCLLNNTLYLDRHTT